MPRVWAYARHYANHVSGMDWLTDTVARSVIFSVVGRLMRSMTLTEALIVAAIVVVAFLAYRRRT